MKCFKCNIIFKSVQLLMKHFRQSHNLGIYETFQCCEDNCFNFFQNMNSFRQHLINKHPLVLELEKNSCLSESTNPNNISDTNFISEIEYNLPINNSIENISYNFDNFITEGASNELINQTEIFDLNDKIKFLQNNALKFILNLHSKNNFARKDVEDVQNLVVKLLTEPITCMLHDLIDKKDKTDHFVYNIKCLLDSIKNPFSENTTEHILNNNLIKNNLVDNVTLFTINNTISEININGEATFDEDITQGVLMPLKFQFQKFCEKNDNLLKMLENIRNYSFGDNDDLKNYVNGESWTKKCEQFEGKNIVPYFLHSDGYETNNALGANSNVHNLNNVYYSFPCSNENSKLSEIFLASTIKSNDLKTYGADSCLTNLVFTLKDLEDQGLVIQTKDGPLETHFILALVLGDNPGLNEFLEFNSSFSSNYFCRCCKEPKSVTKYQCTQNDNLMRNVENYTQDAQALSPLQTGVKKESIFNMIESFHVTTNFSVDLMHDWYEGVCSYALCHVIKYYIGQNKFSLDILNNRKQCFNYGSIEIEHLSKPIQPHHLQNNRLKMSARQMMTFVQYFPLIIGNLIDQNDEVWLFCLNLSHINDILLKFTIPVSQIQILKEKIQLLNSEYIRLFNDTLKPKFHILIHYPTVIQMSGPVRHFWGMRFEGKHKEFKIYSHVINSRKNICLTLARKYQLKFANYLTQDESPIYVIRENHKILSEFETFICESLNLQSNNFVCYSTLHYRGYLYKTDFYLTQRINGTIKAYKIKHAILYEAHDKTCIKLICEVISNIRYEEHFAAYSMDPSCVDNLIIIDIDEFSGPPVNLNMIHGGTHMLKPKEFF